MTAFEGLLEDVSRSFVLNLIVILPEKVQYNTPLLCFKWCFLRLSHAANACLCERSVCSQNGGLLQSARRFDFVYGEERNQTFVVKSKYLLQDYLE